MTQQQRKRLGNVSERGLRLLIAVRRHERENSGIGVSVDGLLEGRPPSWWITVTRLQQQNLLALMPDRTLRTVGRARAITPSWWGRSEIRQ